MKRAHLAIIALIILPIGIWLYLARPILIAEAKSPNQRYGGKIRIVELPSSGFASLLLRDNPRYRFEYIFPDGYLWSSATHVGESYRANSGKVVWEKNNRATCYLDDLPIYTLNGRLFENYNHDENQ
jgi:hypothetical protein